MTSKIECRLASTTVCLCFVVVAVVFGHAELGIRSNAAICIEGIWSSSSITTCELPCKETCVLNLRRKWMVLLGTEWRKLYS